MIRIHTYMIVDSSYDPLTDDIWVYDQNTHIYDVYRNETIDTTSQYYFLIWCQARDDSKVPDPVPAFNWVSVIEPRFERTAIIIDATSFPNKPYDNSTEPIVKRVLGQMIDDWAGAGSFDFETFPEDILYSFPDGTRCRIQYKKYFASQDYYPISKLTKCDNYGISAVSLRDILKHKIVIVVKDNPGGELIMDNAIMLSVLDGLNAGMSAWSMVRSPFQGLVSSICVSPVGRAPLMILPRMKMVHISMPGPGSKILSEQYRFLKVVILSICRISQSIQTCLRIAISGWTAQASISMTTGVLIPTIRRERS